jgi:hypothetical protein
VNALRHVHSLLVPGGTLVDAHPVTEDRVETDDGVVGTIREPDWVNVDLPNAEEGVRRVVADGLFALEAEMAYDVLQHFDDPEELIEKTGERLEGQDALVAAMRATQRPLRTRCRVVMRRLRALP